MATEYVAYCWRGGRIAVGTRCPEHALPLFRGSKHHLYKVIRGTARRGLGGISLVPGVPEAATDNDAVDAVIAYRDWVLDKLPKTSAGVRRAL